VVALARRDEIGIDSQQLVAWGASIVRGEIRRHMRAGGAGARATARGVKIRLGNLRSHEGDQA
jgi:hypothetical protein